MLDFESILSQQLGSYAAYLSGNGLASVLVIKGICGSAEQAGNLPFSGADGEALEKALSALDWGPNVWRGVLLNPQDEQPLDVANLRLIIEAFDPLTIITTDEVARLALIQACSLEKTNQAHLFVPGGTISVLGRMLVSVDGFEAALTNPKAKQVAWMQLKQARFSRQAIK